MRGRLSPKPQPEEEVQQPSTPLVGSSWQQLPDGFLTLALTDEHSALSSRSSMSEGTAHAEVAAHALPGGADNEDAVPELPVLHLQVCRTSVLSHSLVLRPAHCSIRCPADSLLLGCPMLRVFDSLNTLR